MVPGKGWPVASRRQIMYRVKDDVFSVTPAEQEPAVQVAPKFSECLPWGVGGPVCTQKRSQVFK